jgi:methyl-accepting chemotaxis protein
MQDWQNEDFSSEQSAEEAEILRKAMDEIAFQTNLLAINVALEAASSGNKNGEISATVDEVTFLAQQASKVARDTNLLIGQTVQIVKDGNRLTRQSLEAFQEKMRVLGKIGTLLASMAAGQGDIQPT